VVVWQLAKRRQGTHKTKGRNEVRGSTRKVYAQKKTGRARHGTIRAPIFRHGGIAHGPVVRSHAFSLPKKVRALGLKVALSAKASDPHTLWVVDPASLPTEPKTRAVAKVLRAHGWTQGRTVVFVGPGDHGLPFELASRNVPNMDVLRARGVNVYDLVRARRVVLTTDALAHVAARFGATVIVRRDPAAPIAAPTPQT
jgi:large subunit ribosomal protein L4